MSYVAIKLQDPTRPSSALEIRGYKPLRSNLGKIKQWHFLRVEPKHLHVSYRNYYFLSFHKSHSIALVCRYWEQDT